MDDRHVNYGTKMERETEAKDRYGGLPDNAKPDNKILDDILNVSNACRNIQRKRANEYEQKNLRRQERIEREMREEQEHRDKYEAYINNFLDKKKRSARQLRRRNRKKQKRQISIKG